MLKKNLYFYSFLALSLPVFGQFQSGVTLPDGTVVPSGLAFRNEFHLTPYSSADLFVPCGGRPEAVNLKNVNRSYGIFCTEVKCFF